MAVHKRLQIASGSAVPTAGQHGPIDTSMYEQAEHFKQRNRRHPMMARPAPKHNWKKILMMVFIILLASYLIYLLLNGSKGESSILPAAAKSSSGSGKIFYF